MHEPAAVYSFETIDADVDWITASGRSGDSGRLFRQECEQIIEEERSAGVEVEPALLRDYVGYRSKGVFFGRRDQDSLFVASSQGASRHWQRVARVATGVSRLDLQVTMWTHGEQPRLAKHAYLVLQRQPNRRGRRPALKYIEQQPKGEGIYVGKRKSDAFGRLYDKASEKGFAEQRTCWRAEVEYKRSLARRHADTLSSLPKPRPAVESLVHAWWAAKGLRLPAPVVGHNLTDYPRIKDAERNVLSWFERSLRVTVARAINRHGLDAVLRALGLDSYVQPRERR